MTTTDMFEGRRHSIHIQHMLDEVLREVWRNIDRADEPAAQDLFQQTVEVLGDLRTAYERYETAAETVVP